MTPPDSGDAADLGRERPHQRVGPEQRPRRRDDARDHDNGDAVHHDEEVDALLGSHNDVEEAQDEEDEDEDERGGLRKGGKLAPLLFS